MSTGKKLFTVLVAFAVFAVTVMFESGISETSMDVVRSRIEILPSAGGIQVTRDGKVLAIKDKSELMAGDAVDTPSGETAIVTFSGYGALRLASQSRIEFPVGDASADAFVFRLAKGRAWINTINTSANLNLVAGAAVLVPRRAAFDTSFDGAKTVVKVNVGQVGVGLVKPDYSATEPVRFDAKAFINTYLLAQGSQTTIFQSMVSETAGDLARLLYSKLIKEFQYTLYLKSDFTSDPWLAANLKQDRQLSIDASAAKLKSLNARGLKHASLDSWGYQMQAAAFRFADIFTFSAIKVESRLIDTLFDNLLDAEYLLTYGRTTEAKQRLELFSRVVPEEIAKHGEDFRATVMAKLRAAYAELMYILPGDALYEAKSRISDILFAQLGEEDDDIKEKFGLVREYVNYAYRLADTNPQMARTMLQEYFSRLTGLIDKEKSRLTEMRNIIAEENQIVDNLLKQYAAFYQPDIFVKKYRLENEWLGLLPEGNEKLEEKQSLINTKIDFLKQLQMFFLDEKIVLSDASKIVLNLLVEIKDLMTGSEAAVNQLFELRLKTNTKFLNFITTAQQGALQGATMKQRYESYLAKQKDEISVQQVLEQALSDTPVETVTVITPEEILASALREFTAVGVTGAKFGNVTGAEQKMISVESAQLSGITFSGQYDWEKRLISEVTVSGNVVSRQPVRLENLGIIITPKVEEKTPVETTQTQTTETVSKAEKVARLLLIQKMRNSDITVVDADITVLDLTGGQFVIKKATLISNPAVSMAFSFNGKANIASVMVVKTDKGDVRVEGDVNLADIAAKALEIYNGSGQGG
jgi:hypothetical protein